MINFIKIVENIFLGSIVLMTTFACSRKTIVIPSLKKAFHLPNTSIPVELSVIETGYAKVPEFMVVKGGKIFKKSRISYSSFVIKHPKAVIFFDTGLGRNIESIFKEEVGTLGKVIFRYIKTNPIDFQYLKNNTFKDKDIGVVLSHLHWDHAGGIEDLKGEPVWVSKPEYDFAMWEEHGKNKPFIKKQFDSDSINWRFIAFENKPYEVFSKSYDFFDDGTIVAVPLPGHTPGSIGLFVNISADKRYFLIGDLAWNLKGVLKNSARPKISSNFVDYNHEKLIEVLNLVHRLQAEYEEIKVVPSHDYDVIKKLKQFPEFEGSKNISME